MDAGITDTKARLTMDIVLVATTIMVARVLAIACRSHLCRRSSPT